MKMLSPDLVLIMCNYDDKCEIKQWNLKNYEKIMTRYPKVKFY